MVEVRKSNVFIKWLDKLQDDRAIACINKHIWRLAEGNPGNCGTIGDGLSEMRIHYGPGYRVYFKDTGRELVILLCGGGKSTQQADIIKAKKIAKLYDEE